MENPNYTKEDLGWLPTRKTRRQVVMLTLLACWFGIGYILHFGEPTNSLHSSALSWFFFTKLATIGAYAFGAAWENTSLFGKLIAPK